MKTKLILLALVLSAVQYTAAQDRPPKSDANRPVAGGGTPIPFTNATVIEINSRQNAVLKIGGSAKSFRLAAQPAYFDVKGALIDERSISKGTHVLAHFMVENGQVLVDRLIIQP